MFGDYIQFAVLHESQWKWILWPSNLCIDVCVCVCVCVRACVCVCTNCSLYVPVQIR